MLKKNPHNSTISSFLSLLLFLIYYYQVLIFKDKAIVLVFKFKKLFAKNKVEIQQNEVYYNIRKP